MNKWIALAVVSALFIGGCGRSDSTSSSAQSDAPDKPVGGYATGTVLASDGKPIQTAGAEITIPIYGVSSAGEKVNYSPAVKPDGSYRQKLVPGSYRFGVTAQIKVPFDGKMVFLPLEPVGSMWNKDRDAQDGIQQNYVWKITGRKPDTAGDVNNFTQWYGGSVTLQLDGYRNDKRAPSLVVPDGTKLTLTLKPTGPRVDGKPAEPITLERTWHQSAIGHIDALNDLPVADYELSGTATLPDGSNKPLLFEISYAKFSPTAPIRFATDSSNGFWPARASWCFE